MFIHAVQITAIAEPVYYVRPPQNGIVSYAYAGMRKLRRCKPEKLKVKVVAHTKETQADARCYQQIQREVLAES